MKDGRLYIFSGITEASIILSFWLDFETHIRLAGVLIGVVVGAMTAVKLWFDIVKRWNEWKDRRLELKIKEEGIKKMISDRYQ